MSVRKEVLCSFAATGILLFGSNAFAEGRIFIQPRVNTVVGIDSNFWKAENEEMSVNTYALKPGVQVLYQTAKTKIDADVELDSYFYDDNDTRPANIKKASDNNYTGFAGKVSVSSQVTDRINLGVNDNLDITRDPASSDSLNNSVDREKYTINRFSPNFYYDFGNKFGVGAKYQNILMDYADTGEDSNENRGVFDFFYNFNRSSAVFLDYQLWHRDYDLNTVDYTSNEVSLNYSQKFNYLTVTVGGGYHNRSFDSTYDDIDAFTWKISLVGQNRVEEGVKPRSKFGLDLVHNFNDAGNDDQYFLATRIALSGSYFITDKFEVGGTASYQNNEYQNDTTNREDDVYAVSGMLAYQIARFVNIGLEVGHEDRDSNIVGRSYDNNYAMIKFDFSYDIGKK